MVANGCARCVNTDPATGAERPAYVKFNDMRLEGDFPIRLWRSGNVVTNDFIEFSGVCTGAGGAFVGEPMEGFALNSGDSFRFATYPAGAPLPVNESRKWRISSVPVDGSPVALMLTYQLPGVKIILR